MMHFTYDSIVLYMQIIYANAQHYCSGTVKREFLKFAQEALLALW